MLVWGTEGEKRGRGGQKQKNSRREEIRGIENIDCSVCTTAVTTESMVNGM